ncbi:hypothetical protein VI06_04410 [Aquitalea magnusonii]|nr:hypothetical protein VI06_04410 [Aquitalea magnusonii]
MVCVRFISSIAIFMITISKAARARAKVIASAATLVPLSDRMYGEQGLDSQPATKVFKTRNSSAYERVTFICSRSLFCAVLATKTGSRASGSEPCAFGGIFRVFSQRKVILFLLLMMI